ncbi:MAG: hypothetical protein AVDCRST_MAG68-2146 [uncultured Gemmatimonadetes bacterium]|uniref:Uncharacterized protein n=1 Tax=uncultured Gemmatimonadota bacterium TaxID=203437 RepID=A0A6J4L6J0_9BACT|nr:MAG: hypothetical protein AVDCRST_MAG68-2146 [uncultured Gemmatimonadota bacterium]
MEDFGAWQESGDLEITADPEFDRDAYGLGREPLAAQPEQGERELTRTFELPRDRNAIKRLIAIFAAGGGYFDISDQYLEPRTKAAFDLPIVSHGQLIGLTASGANINEPNGKATLQLTFATGGLPVA